MYLLMRRISAYTSPDVLLGVFRTPDEAEAAKVSYIIARGADPESDPWKNQGHKDAVPLEQDLEVEQLPGDFPTGSEVFVVSDHCDGLGQEIRKLDSLHATALAAESRVAELDAVDDADAVFPHYAVLDWVIVGSLHSDFREDQPQPRWRQRPNK
ncbi:hypothetical protein [Zavarzinella formosa]|uniref:hypothetical protein n=1 Tax=Zavarzinella formosa TaxID=360055 RepID=UPI0002F5C70E|nr:hypothetical protein [Zavarzinella formosa]